MVITNQDGLTAKWIGKKSYHKHVTGSTSADIRILAAEGAADGTVVSADFQTAGAGRRGRSWQSEEGSNLLFSLLLRPDIQPDTAPQLTLLMALAAAGTIREVCGLNAQIKWPNDIVINKKKVCGILTEMNISGKNIDYVVVGTGINVNQAFMPEEFAFGATSLRLEKGCPFSREELLRRILFHFEQYYEKFLEKGGLQEFVIEYNEWLVSLNTEVRVLDPKGEFSGICRGINEKGEMLVELPGKETVAIYAGEVSVRGLYGYV